VLATVGYYHALLALGLATAALGPTLPGLAQQTQSDLRAVSVLFAAGSLGYLLGSVQGGRWYDRRWGHRLLAAALLVVAVTLTLTPLMSSRWSLAVVLLVLGAAEGAVDVGGNTLLVWVHHERVGPWMNGLHLCFGIGAVLAPLIVAQSASIEGDLTRAFWVLALLVLPGAVLLPWLPSPAAPATRETSGAKETPSLLVFWIAVFLGLYVGAEIGFGGWVFTYALELNLTSATEAAHLTAAFWLAFTLGRLLAVPLSMRLQPHRILMGDLAGCLAGVGILWGWPHSAAALWLGTVATGLFMASIFPVTLSLAGRRLVITGRVTGWFIVGGAAGSMTVPWLMGQMFASVGPRSLMLILLVDLLVAAVILAGLLGRSTSSRHPRTLAASGSPQWEKQ
jgi:FHS family Na+ dependent glucose MFS transporter 1